MIGRKAWARVVGCLSVLLLVAACGSGQDGTTRTADDVEGEDRELRDEDIYQAEGPRTRVSPDERADGQPAEDRSTGDPLAGAAPVSEVPPRRPMSASATGEFQRGLQLVDAGRLEEAARAFEAVLRADSGAYQGAFNLGVVQERLGQTAQARASYQRALEIQPDYERAVEAMARMDVRQGRVQQALAFVEPLARRYGTNLPLLNLYADLLVQASRMRDAMAVARQVLRRDERNVLAMLVFAKSNYHLGRHDLALWVLDQAAEIDASSGELFNVRGFVLLAMGNRLAAIEAFERAVRANPGYAEARNNLGVQYLISGRYDDAIAQLEAARQLNPTWVSVYLNIGDAYRGAQQWEKARGALEKALRLESDLPEAHYNLGVLYLAATKIEGMDRSAQLQKSIDAFQTYKRMAASRLKADDPVDRLLQDARRAFEREQTRAERERAAAEEAARRAATKTATPTTPTTPTTPDPGTGEDGGEDDGWE